MIYIEVLEGIIVSLGNLAKFQYSIPPIDRWTIREVDSSAQSYASGMSNGIYWKLG